MNYAVTDLGEGFYPAHVNNNGDVVGYLNDQSLARMADGSIIPVPGQPWSPFRISDNGLVLCFSGMGSPMLFDVKSLNSQAIDVPGVSVTDIDANANIVGVGLENYFTGALVDYQTKAVALVESPLSILPPPFTPQWMTLNARNTKGHAVGVVTGWLNDGSTLAVPVFYDGSTVIPIGMPGLNAIAQTITENDRMMVVYEPLPDANTRIRAIYDGVAKSFIPCPQASIWSMNSSGSILWASGGEPYLQPLYLTDAWGMATAVDQLFPANSGWSQSAAPDTTYCRGALNDRGDIIGVATLAGKSHGFMLSPDRRFPPPPPRTPVVRVPSKAAIVAGIIWGIINDSGGIQRVGGIIQHIPPGSPVEVLLQAFPEALRKELTGIIDNAQLDNPVGAVEFTLLARGALGRHKRSWRPGR